MEGAENVAEVACEQRQVSKELLQKLERKVSMVKMGQLNHHQENSSTEFGGKHIYRNPATPIFIL